MNGPDRQSSSHRAWVPSVVTAACLATGLVSMVLAAEGRYDAAVYMLILAVVLDILDGRLARWLRATSGFGQQLDSFNDALSFGAAPALLVYLAALRPLGSVGVLVGVAHLLAAVFRLARFNLTTDPHEKSALTCGVPTPISAGVLMVVVLMRDQLPAPAAAGVVLFAALAMISRWVLPAFHGRSVTTAMLVVAMLNFLAIVVWPNWLTVGWWALWNLAIVLVARVRQRRLALETHGDG